MMLASITAQQLEQLDSQLSELDSQGSLFFDKVANALTSPYSLDEARKNRDTILHTLDNVESLLSQTNLIYLCEHNPEDPLPKLKETTDAQLAQLYKTKEKIVKNIERTRTVVLKQQ